MKELFGFQSLLLEAFIFVILYTFIGFILKHIVKKYATQFAQKTVWEYDDIIFEQIENKLVVWGLAFGLYKAISPIAESLKLSDSSVAYMEETVVAIVIFSLTSMLAKVIGSLFEIKSKAANTSSSILSNIAKSLIYAGGLLIIVQNYGIEVYPLLTTLGLGGLAVALALQPTLSNLFSGLQIIASGKINIGDIIELENGKRGTVQDISWRSTSIVTAQNNVIVIPNSKVADSIIENFFLADKEVTFHVLIGVGYDSDLDQVEKVCLEVANQVLTENGTMAKDFEPFVRFFNFGESSIDLKVFMKVNEYADQFLMTSLFIKEIQKRFNQENIEIPFPIRTLIQQ